MLLLIIPKYQRCMLLLLLYTMSLYFLHWLTIPQRVQYKLAMTVHRCLRCRAPRYLADCCMPVSEVSGRQHLRSASRRKLNIPLFCRSTFGTLAFSVGARRFGTHCLIRCVIRPSSLNALQAGLENASLCRTLET